MTTLTDEQASILGLLASGRTAAEVARELHVSERTLRRRTREICANLGVATHVEAIVWAVRRGVV